MSNREEKKCSICNHCKDPNCIGWYLLHPKEVSLFVPRLKEHNLKINKDRTFKMIDSPSSGEIFTTFKELHVLKGKDEDKETAKCAEVYTKDLQEKIMKGIYRRDHIGRSIR